MTIPLDVHILKIGLNFVKAKAGGDWESVAKLIKLGTSDSRGAFITLTYALLGL